MMVGTDKIDSEAAVATAMTTTTHHRNVGVVVAFIVVSPLIKP